MHIQLDACRKLKEVATSDVDMALLLDAPGACDLLQIVIIGLLSTHSGLELLQPACCVIEQPFVECDFHRLEACSGSDYTESNEFLAQAGYQ